MVFYVADDNSSIEIEGRKKYAKRRKNEKEGLNAIALDWKNSQN